MSMTVNLPDDVARRLAAEAERRGQEVDQVAAELLAATLPAGEDAEAPSRRSLSFIGIGASGGRDRIAERHEEIIREHFSTKTAGDV